MCFHVNRYGDKFILYGFVAIVFCDMAIVKDEKVENLDNLFPNFTVYVLRHFLDTFVL